MPVGCWVFFSAAVLLCCMQLAESSIGEAGVFIGAFLVYTSAS